MTGTLGVTETAWPQDPVLVAGNYRAMKAEAIAAAEGELDRGTVLARNESTNKLVALDKEVAVTTETVVTDAGGSLKVFDIFLANAQVIPTTVTVSALVGAATVSLTDANGDGKLSGAGGKGHINYESGYAFLSYTTAPDDDTDITVAYTHGTAAQTHKPVAVLAEDVDATSEVTAQVYLAGEFRADDLAWPSGISANNKTRARKQLQALGMITK